MTLDETRNIIESIRGLRNKQIARKLHLSEGTVQNYISAIYMKLQVGTPDVSRGEDKSG
ncbi:MAG TPA: hypothetical protein DEA91_06095 [Paenibacillus sp.]|nr:hypothetical protein [Paenibacillus sp.]